MRGARHHEDLRKTEGSQNSQRRCLWRPMLLPGQMGEVAQIPDYAGLIR